MSRIVLTDGTTPADVSSGNTQVYTKSGGAPGTDGLYYKQGSDPEVGPLATAGTVTDLQTAYDGGNTIDATIGGGTVRIRTANDSLTNLQIQKLPTTTTAGNGLDIGMNANTSGDAISIQSLGEGDGIYINNGGPSGNALSIEMGATTTKSAIYILQLGIGGGIEVGLPNTNSASGFYVEHGDSSSTGDGIQVIQKGTGEGVQIGHTGLSGNGLNVVLSDGSNIDHAIQASHVGNGSNLHLVRTSGLGALISSDPSVFNVDNAGNTTTPSVIFGGSGTITVEGDSGVAGEPINPRVSLTSGPTSVGVLSRTWYAEVKEGGGGPFDMETLPSGQYADIRNEQPTLIRWDNTFGGAQTAYLPDAARYPRGTEIQFWNISATPGNNVTLTNFGVGGQQILDLSGAAASQTVTPGSGRRLVAFGDGLSGWFVTGVI